MRFDMSTYSGKRCSVYVLNLLGSLMEDNDSGLLFKKENNLRTYRAEYCVPNIVNFYKYSFVQLSRLRLLFNFFLLAYDGSI
jgi:hypothetical protein